MVAVMGTMTRGHDIVATLANSTTVVVMVIMQTFFCCIPSTIACYDGMKAL